MAISFHGLTHGTFPMTQMLARENRTSVDMEISHDFTAFSVGQMRVRQIKAPCAKRNLSVIPSKTATRIAIPWQFQVEYDQPHWVVQPHHPTRLVFATTNSRKRRRQAARSSSKQSTSTKRGPWIHPMD